MWVADPQGLGDLCSSCLALPHQPGGAPASAETPASSTFRVGAAVTWRGQTWMVAAVHNHPQLGNFVRLETGDGGYDLVHANGSDGALEPLDRGA